MSDITKQIQALATDSVSITDARIDTQEHDISLDVEMDDYAIEVRCDIDFLHAMQEPKFRDWFITNSARILQVACDAVE